MPSLRTSAEPLRGLQTTHAHRRERLSAVFRQTDGRTDGQIVHQIIIIPFLKTNEFVNLIELCVFLCQTSPVGLRIAAVQELLLE